MRRLFSWINTKRYNFECNVELEGKGKEKWDVKLWQKHDIEWCLCCEASGGRANKIVKQTGCWCHQSRWLSGRTSPAFAEGTRFDSRPGRLAIFFFRFCQNFTSHFPFSPFFLLFLRPFAKREGCLLRTWEKRVSQAVAKPIIIDAPVTLVNCKRKGRRCALVSTHRIKSSISLKYRQNQWTNDTKRVKLLPWTKKKSPEIRGEKNTVHHVISCLIMHDQHRAKVADSRGWPCLALIARDQAWYHKIEQCSSCRESQGRFWWWSGVVGNI